MQPEPAACRKNVVELSSQRNRIGRRGGLPGAILARQPYREASRAVRGRAIEPLMSPITDLFQLASPQRLMPAATTQDAWR
jgi:hypothetical protein